MAMAQDSNSPPEVTNVVAQQVEISYDLLDRDGDLMTVSLQVSSDGGSNFDLETNSLTGEVGKSIASGQGKKIIWQVAVDIPDLYGTNFVFEVVADDNVGPTAGFVHPVDGASMALIPAGSFEMGDSKDEPEAWMKWSRPVHTVELDAFYMDVHEVTVGQFRKFVEESGYVYNLWDDVAVFSPTGKHPMIWVTWDDATAYAKWADKRLPTEAEWEYAARGGLIGKRYPWGDEITHDHANWGNTVSGKDKWNRCAPVGSFDPNGYGLYDMVGNVLEWCSDWYDPDYYSNSPLRNPQGPSTGEWRVLRGGSWLSASPHYPALTLRVASRLNFYPKCRDGYYGFRCVSGFN